MTQPFSDSDTAPLRLPVTPSPPPAPEGAANGARTPDPASLHPPEATPFTSAASNRPRAQAPTNSELGLVRSRPAPKSGWRKAIHRATGLNPGESAAETTHRAIVDRVNQPVRGGPFTIAVLSQKGGVGKTTTTVGLGATLAAIQPTVGRSVGAYLRTQGRLVHTAGMQITQQDLKAISERYFAAWAARDPDAIVALHTEDTRFWMHMGGEPVVGRDAVRATFAEIFEQFPELTWETYRVLHGEDHWILDWALISGDIRFDCLDVVNVAPDGLVVRKDTFVDSVQLQAALGAVNA